MKSKKFIKTIDDIKYCEEHGLTIYSEIEPRYYEFHNNVWCSYDEDSRDIKVYNCEMFLYDLELYYYEEEQKQQEATEKDIGKLCWVSDDDCGNRDAECFIAILSEVCDYGRRFRDESGSRWEHCFPLTKEEIKEFMEKAE